MNRFITNEDVLKLPEIDDWKVYEDEMSGTIEWDNGLGIIIYATPNWTNEGVVPFSVYTEESGEYETAKELQLQKNTSIKSQLNSYIETLRNVIKII